MSRAHASHMQRAEGETSCRPRSITADEIRELARGCWPLQKDDEKDDKQDEPEQAYSDIHRRLLSGKARTSVHPAVSDASASSRKPDAKTPTPQSAPAPNALTGARLIPLRFRFLGHRFVHPVRPRKYRVRIA
jgi:hypothetical protein